MTLPASIRVGPHDVRIERAQEIDGNESWGTYNTELQVMTLLTQYPTATREVDTFLHELFHAIWAVMHCPEEGEEPIVGRMATGLTQVFRDHPEILGWVKDTLHDR